MLRTFLIELRKKVEHVVGQLLGDLPAGWIVARAGEKSAMLGALAAAGVGIAIAAFAAGSAYADLYRLKKAEKVLSARLSTE